MTRPRYPNADRLDLVETLHGHRVADPYRWLEDAGSAQTTAWAAEQDALFAAELAAMPGRDAVHRRLRSLLDAGVQGAPVWRGSRHFFVRRNPGQEHGALVVADPGGERVLYDPIEEDPSGATTLDTWRPNVEGDLVAYQVSQGGTEESVLRVLNVASGAVVDGPIDRARYSPVAWLPSGHPAGPGFYYVRRLDPAGLPADEEQYHRRVWLHVLGQDPACDALVFGEGLDLTNYYGAWASRDGRWLVVSAAAGTAPRNDVWIADLYDEHGRATPERALAPDLRPVAVGLDGRTGAHVGRDGRLYLHTDVDAPRGRLAVADPADPGNPASPWRDLLPEDPHAVLEDVAILDGEELPRPLLLAEWTRHAVAEVTVHDLRTGDRVGELVLPGLGTVGGLIERPEGGHEAWFTYTDHTTPVQVHRWDARSGELSVWALPPGHVNVPDVTTQHLEFRSADGEVVRMFVTARADLLHESTGAPLEPRPTILYGYGGFAVPMAPGFSAGILAWAEAGGVYAVAQLRGGSEEGEDWHRAGMLGAKQRVFDDCHAAAEELRRSGWTGPGQLTISGGSNGGLLVGAAITQRPDLYDAALCAAPLLDMVRYEQFGLGATWASEYGTVEDPEQLDWLLGYSPYHHVVDSVAYPAVLFTVFDGDTRVDPMHARKMCAALQHATTSDAPVLFRREANVGHGARAISRSLDLMADTLTFAAARTGLELTGVPDLAPSA